MNKILIFTAESIVERDSLIALLKSNGVNAESPRRDISRKYTENTLDLSYGGYSTIFDGFKIFVDKESKDKATKLVDEFREDIKVKNKVDIKNGSKRNLMKFYYFSIASFFIPILPLFFGLYYFYKGILQKEKIQVFYMIGAITFYILSIFVAYKMVIESFTKILSFIG